MPNVTLYHNPRCSKSRDALTLLQNTGCHIDIIEYLKTPPDANAIKTLLAQLQLSPRELMRTKEAEYKELGLDNPELTDDELIAALVATPKLIERPIAVANGKAIIGRPPIQVLSIL
ncbi:arsenate reductase (glutaredoxin) [Shewanella yunxiaonensis]|uniref:Arsenate reductase n=1 Tax=Shewanella yunxiaonensis TaxID=2829809 RepID=A0ABX7YP98_9GAMM|nr:arsenate reductase (glutaredoxin) [Shewanella yunxiaonensis]QUN04454.1 arsenate reductase (glutaredoxin) [Shewanella yunxiaonensis]